MTDEHRFGLELLQTLEAQISRQIVILFAHVRHEQFVRQMGTVTAFACHRLVLFQELDVSFDKIQFGVGDQMAILFWLIIIEDDLRKTWRRFWFGHRFDDGRRNWVFGVMGSWTCRRGD